MHGSSLGNIILSFLKFLVKERKLSFNQSYIKKTSTGYLWLNPTLGITVIEEKYKYELLTWKSQKQLFTLRSHNQLPTYISQTVRIE
jgi:hypothetical protein